MKRAAILLLLLPLFVWRAGLPEPAVAQNVNTPASPSALTVVSVTIEGWQDRHAGSYELWIFSSDDWIDTNNVPHGAGNPQNRIWTQRITGLTVDSGAHTLTIPSFQLQPTRNAIRGASVRLTFWIAAVSGNSVVFVAQVPGTTQGLTIPPSLASTSGCSPSSQCASFADLVVYNSPSPALPPDGYYNRAEVDRLIATQLIGAPAGATYITQIPNGPLTNEQALSQLSTGVLKVTGGTGVLSTATPGADYQPPVTASSPLTFNGSVVAMPAASGSQNGYLSSSDWNGFNNKQAALGYTAENTANKNAANGYAGLSGGKVANSQIAEILALADLSDVSGASGTGSTVLKGTFTAPSAGQVPTFNGTDWLPATPNAGTVTSVALSTNASFLTVSGSPVTAAGTLTANLTTGLAANQIVATPDTTTGTVGLRALVNNDLPTVNVAHGGTGLPSVTPYAVLAGGTASTGNLQQVSSLGGSGQVLTSNGPGALPTWQNAPGGVTAFLNATDAVNSAPIRGGIVTAQGSGVASWIQLALGAGGLPLVSNGTDVVYGQASLTAGVSGILPIANGGTNATSANYSTNGVHYFDGTRIVSTATGGSGTLCLTETDSGPPVWGSCAGSAATSWSSLTAPGSSLAVAMGANTTTFTWGGATGASDTFTLKDATTNTSASGHLLAVNSVGSSTIKPVLFTVGGTTNGVEMTASGVLAPIGTGGITANALNGVAADGIQVRTAAGSFSSRTIVAAASGGAVVVNGDGVGANPSISIDLSTLAANQTLWDSTQSSRTLTAGLSGANDPVITFNDNVVNVSTGTLQQGGTAVVLQSRTLTGGAGINTIGDLSANRTISVDQSFSPVWTGVHTWTPAARSSGTAAYFTVNTPADTGITANTASPGVLFTSNSRIWATSTSFSSDQQEIYFRKPTYDASGTSTMSGNVATVAIEGAPAAGGSGNLTIASPYALNVKAGNVLFAGLVKAGSGPTTLTDSAGKILSAALNTVALANGGTGAALTASNGGIFYSTASAGAILNGTATANKLLMSGASAAPAWSTPTYPNAASTAGLYLVTDGTNVVTKAAPGVVTVLTDGATISTDAGLGNRFRVTLGGNRTLANPTNAVDGQQMVWEIIQDATGSRTITLGTKFVLGTDITAVTLTTTANKRDYLTAAYNASADKFYVTGFIKGY